MIDTIVLHLYDLKLHSRLVAYLRGGLSTKKGVTKYVKSMPREAADFDPDYYTTLLKFNDSGKVIELSHHDTLYGPSNHYELRYNIVISKDRIEFNFSIPKFLYGTNFLQFVENFGDPKFSFSSHCKWSRNQSQSYVRFNAFVDQFFRYHFSEFNVYAELLVLSRIDFCFNQVFKTVEARDKYFLHQRGIRKKFSSGENKQGNRWGTSIFFNSLTHSFKIYKKGIEYKQNDKKHHKRINTEKGYDYFNIDAIQEVTNRTLRYEATFRNSYMSNIYMTKVFRRECGDWNTIMEKYRESRKFLNQHHPIEHALKTKSNSDLRKKHLLLRAKHQKRFNSVNKLLNKRLLFTRAKQPDQSINRFTNLNKPLSYSRWQSYDKPLHDHLQLRFKEWFDDFQITDIDSLSHLILKVEHINSEKIKNGARPMSGGFISMLKNMRLTGMSMDQIQQEEIYKSTTFYRYKKWLRELVGTKHHSFGELETPLDFKNYHQELSKTTFVRN